MKIDKLSIFNLNSLSGKSEISFDKKPFNGSGLFAITGPTGAGKSTIFDAICLALYGRTPRLKNPDDIMTRHSGECYAELTFSINGDRYRSRWEQRRSRGKADGKLQNSKMSLVSIKGCDESLLEERKSAVPLLIASITGLDYDQFTRSILLAQGNFASFLKAGMNERAELLEKMTGSELYTRLSIEAFNRAKEEEESLLRLKEKIGDMDILSHEERNHSVAQLNDFIKKRDEAGEIRALFEEAKNWQDQEVVLKLRVENSRYDLEMAEGNEDQSKDLVARFEQTQRIVQHMPVYESWIYLKNEHKRLLDQTIQLEINSSESAVEITLLEKELGSCQDSLQSAREYEEMVSKQIRQMEIKENSLKSLTDQINRIEEERIGLEDQLEDNNRKEEELRKKIKLSRNKISTLSIYLENNHPHEKINESLPLLKDLSNRLNELQGSTPIPLVKIPEQEAQKRKELEELCNNISIIEMEKPGDLAELQNVKEILLKMSPVSRQFREIEKGKNLSLDNKISCEKLIRERTEELAELKEKHEKNLIIKKERHFSAIVDEVKSQLHDGDTCPVCCGVYHSNFSEDKLAANIVDLSEESLEKIIQEVHGAREVLLQQYRDSETHIAQSDQSLMELLSEWDEIKGDLFPGLHPLNRDEANSIYSDFEKKIVDCHNWQKELENLKNDETAIRSIHEKLNKLSQIWDDIKKMLDQFSLDSDIETIPIKQLEQINREYRNKKEEVETLNIEISTLNNNLESISIMRASRESQISKIKENLYNLIKQRLELQEDLKEISHGKSITELEREKKKRIDLAENMMAHVRNKLQEKKESFSSFQGRLKSNRIELPGLAHKLEDKESQLKAVLDKEKLALKDFKIDGLAEDLEKLKEQIDQIRETKIRAEEALLHSKMSLDDHIKIKPDDVYLENTASKLEDTYKAIEEASRNIGIFEEKINRDDSARSHLRELSEKIEAQEIECLRWGKIKSLIGSADGKSYRRFVQGLTLEKLVNLSNRHLERLNNRYRIERNLEKELEVEIVDSWQADTVRPAATLSGGESFLVSLALSLGLSELVGNKVIIDSLFLDEGFGTLDPDSLEIVLSALETLQSSGKLIGIISHIEAIRERISVQIRVKKLAGGKSILEIV